jgi:hypothetical protein
VSEDLKPWQLRTRCRRCQDVIYSRYSGEFRSCRCGAIFVDQTTHYARMGGEAEDFEILDQEDKT